jgi:hypothetical protein
MRLSTWRIAIGALILLWGFRFAGGADDKKGVVVVIDDLKAVAPEAWKKEKPSNTFRQYQFKLPKVEDDKEDAELVVSNNVLGKSDEDILKRWKKMFLLPEGKTVDDVGKVETIKSGKVTLVYLDIQGVYLHKKLPIDPDFKAVQKPGYRMLRVLFKTKNDVNYVSVIGPAKTVESHKKQFDEWLKAFK